MLTACELIALASGRLLNSGSRRCFFCGAPCDETLATSVFVKSTFFDWDAVAFPASKFVCVGCTLTLDEKIPMPGREKPQKFRNYSWLITPASAQSFDKGRISEMRAICLAPPEPPWAFALAASGQKHLVYRTPVNLSIGACAVRLELDVVQYAPPRLAERVELAKRVCAATGKPALQEPWSAGLAFASEKHHGSISCVEEWQSIRGEPLSKLAAFLCPNMEDSRRDYPARVTAA